jgi:hypothetical protein
MHPDVMRLAAAERIDDWLAAAEATRRARAGRSTRSSRPRWWSGLSLVTSRHPAARGA